MESEETHTMEREEEMQHLIELADSYFVKNGRFPSKIRVGVSVGKRVFPADASRAVTPHFAVELDKAIGADEVVLDP